MGEDKHRSGKAIYIPKNGIYLGHRNSTRVAFTECRVAFLHWIQDLGWDGHCSRSWGCTRELGGLPTLSQSLHLNGGWGAESGNTLFGKWSVMDTEQRHGQTGGGAGGRGGLINGAKVAQHIWCRELI